MPASIFDGRVRDGWRETDPPLSTPGIVLTHSTTGETNFVDGYRPRIPPYWVEGGVNAYLHGFSISTTPGSNGIRIEVRRENSATQVELTNLDQLGIVLRSGDRVLSLRVSDIRGSDVTSPYSWSGDGVGEFGAAISGKRVFLAFVDITSSNVLLETGEVNDPEPSFVPLVPVVEPVSIFHPAVRPGHGDNNVEDATPACVWRHVRRGYRDDVAGVVSLVDTTIDGLEAALPRIPPLFAQGAQDAYVVLLSVASGRLRIDLQPSPYDLRTSQHARHIDLESLVLFLRSGETMLTVDLSELTGIDSEEPYDWTLPDVTAQYTDGNFIAVLVDKKSPNLDIENAQFRFLGDSRSVAVENQGIDTLRTSVSILYQEAAETDIPVITTGPPTSVSGSVNIQRIPHTGRTPASTPITVEVGERPESGRYRNRRWVDHTGDLRSATITASLGEPGNISAELSNRRRTRASWNPTATEYIGRPLAQRARDEQRLGLIFQATHPASRMERDDEVYLDGVIVEPAASVSDVAWLVTDRQIRGGQRYSVFDHGSPSATDLAGLRARATGVFNNTRLSVQMIIGDASITEVILSSTGFILRVEEGIESIGQLNDLFVRHNNSGESWYVDLSTQSSVSGNFLIAVLPEPDRGSLVSRSLSNPDSWTVTIAATRLADDDGRLEPNPRIDTGQREVVLQQGDGIQTDVDPAEPTEDRYVGLAARVVVNDPGSTATEILDTTSRFLVDVDRYISGVRLQDASVLVDVQNGLGQPQTLSANVLSKFSLVIAGQVYPLAGASYNGGTYTLPRSAAPLRADLDGEGVISVLAVETGHWALDGLALGTNDGDLVELVFQPPLVPRSIIARYEWTLPTNPPQIAYADTRGETPWKPVDGAEVRCVLHQWSPVSAIGTLPTAGRLRLTHTGNNIIPPLSPRDKVVVVKGVELLDGSDSAVTELQIVELADTYIEVDCECDLTGGVCSWYRAIDRVPVFGGWLINPSVNLTGGDNQAVSASGVDYSVVFDRRLHGGGTLVSTGGETSGEFLSRLLNQWQTGIPGVGSEGIIDNIDHSIGNAITPSFSTLEAGGSRSYWRSFLEALQARAGEDIGYIIDASKTLQWRRHGQPNGLILSDNNYQTIDIQEDRSQARNVVSTRSTPEDSIIVESIDEGYVQDRQRVEGGTGRYEAVADSREGSDPGVERARSYGIDNLRRYPFQWTVNLQTIDALERLLTFRQFSSLVSMVPGDSFYLGGQHLPPLPTLIATDIGDGLLYFETQDPTEAIPNAVVPGSLIAIEQLSGDVQKMRWEDDLFRWGDDRFIWAATDNTVQTVLKVVGSDGPRGSFWVQGEGIPIGEPIQAEIMNEWLCTSVSISPLLSAAGLKEWSLSGIRSRRIGVGDPPALAQDGTAGRLRRALSGAL